MWIRQEWRSIGEAAAGRVSEDVCILRLSSDAPAFLAKELARLSDLPRDVPLPIAYPDDAPPNADAFAYFEIVSEPPRDETGEAPDPAGWWNACCLYAVVGTLVGGPILAIYGLIRPIADVASALG